MDIYDAADQRGDTVNIAYLHPVDQPSPTAVSVTPATPAATVPPTPAPVIASVVDLPDAVVYANTNTESRWYVERRWRTLGGEETGITLPWLNGGSEP